MTERRRRRSRSGRCRVVSYAVVGVGGATELANAWTCGLKTRRLRGWVNSAEVVSMLIAPGQVIAGWPAVELRDLMRRMHHRAYTVLAVAEDLQLSEARAEKVVVDLVALGLVERVERPGVSVRGTAEDASAHAGWCFTERLLPATRWARLGWESPWPGRKP